MTDTVYVPTAQDVVEMLGSARFTATTEADLQDGINALLCARYPGLFAREYRLGRLERPDFFCDIAGLAIEVKVGTSGGTAPKVYSQLQRYAQHDVVREIIFATPSRRIASLMPPIANGKLIRTVVLTTGF